MPTVQVINTKGEDVRQVDLSDAVYGITPNEYAVHLCVVGYLHNQRQGTQSTLTRSEVSGGGKKPWRQKGTGRARQGSTRSPQWRHGGIAFGPKPRTYGISVNKKVRRLAIRSALSAKAASEDLLVLDELKLDSIKTKTAAEILSAIGTEKKTLVILPENDVTVYLSMRNIEGTKTATVNTINVYDIVNADSLVIVEEAAKKLEEVYA